MLNLEIISENSKWLVVNKPPGLSVHNLEDTSNLLLELDKLGKPGLSPVNRIDKETSGLVVLSNHKETSAELQEAMRLDSCEKAYLAIIKGSMPINDQGEWSDRLTNKAEGRKNPQGIKSQRVDCLTQFHILNSDKYLSLVSFILKTGRQHQIRKHSVLKKHQVIGDKRYGDKSFNEMIKKQYSFYDMGLHSHSLKFHFNGKDLSFKARTPSSWELFGVFKDGSV